MGIVIHRSTRAIHDSANTPDYDPAEWFTLSGAMEDDAAALADFAALKKVPPRHWKLEDNPKRIVEMSPAEKAVADTPTVPNFRKSKIETIDQHAADYISAGFEYPVGSGERFGFDSTALAELLALHIAPAAKYPIVWFGLGGASIVLGDVTEAALFVGAACDAFTRVRSLVNAKKAEILAAKNRAVLAAIESIDLGSG